MISRAQQILLKCAQREAGLADADYREALGLVSGGCRSSRDPNLTDRAVDLFLSYVEAIYWRNVRAGTLQASCKPDAVFRQPAFWASKNPSGDTSRDRYARFHGQAPVGDVEGELEALGCSAAYLKAIHAKVTRGRTGPDADYAYRAALKRTLNAKRKKLASVEAPSPSGTGTVETPF